MYKFIGKLIFKITGWKLEGSLPNDIKKCVVIAAPHTTNWDIFYARAAFAIMELPVKFTIKDDWMFFPVSVFLKQLGAIGINRRPRKEGEKRPSTVDAISQLFKHREELSILIPAEGTRTKVEKWKTGFYHIAKQANVPIVLGYLDFKKKAAGIGEIIYPTDDFAADMRKIMDFYRDIQGKFPEKFSLDIDYK